MNNEQLAAFAVQLRELRETVAGQEIDDSRLKEGRLTEDYEKASLIIDQSIVTNLLQRKTLYLNQIDSALKKIENGDYGYCFECGDDINIKRLEARPTATLCIICKEVKEKRAKDVNSRGTGINDWEKSTTDER
jgi:DnaK suppressor protein